MLDSKSLRGGQRRRHIKNVKIFTTKSQAGNHSQSSSQYLLYLALNEKARTQKKISVNRNHDSSNKNNYQHKKNAQHLTFTLCKRIIFIQT